MTSEGIPSGSSASPRLSSEAALRRMRQRIWDFDGTPREAQARRVLLYLKKRAIRNIERDRDNAPRGPYSGLTKRELRLSRTCEPDWFRATRNNCRG